MNTLTHNRNYCPIDIETKYHACLRRVESHWPIKKILSYYHVKRSSLYRWLKKFDKTKESLYERSHKPISPHPNTLNNDIVKKILNLHRRNPDISFIEIWVKMVHEGFEVSASSVLRTLHRKKLISHINPRKRGMISSIILRI